MLPSARPQSPALERASALPSTGVSLPAGALTIPVMNFETGSGPAPDARSASGCRAAPIHPPCPGVMRNPRAAMGAGQSGGGPGFLRLQIWRNRRRLAHQGDGDAAIGGHEGVVGEQRIGVGLAANLVEIGCRKALLFEDLAHHIGTV